LTICGIPQITHFLGPIVTLKPGKTQARTRATHSIIAELLEQIAHYDHVEITVGTGLVDLTPFLVAGYEVKVHPTFLLDCRRKPEDLWAGLRDKTKNVIRRARECLRVRDIDGVNLFVSFYKENLEGVKSYFDLSFMAPAYAAAHARQQAKIVAAVDSSRVVHAKVFFIWDDRCFHYLLFGTSQKRGASRRGQFAAVELNRLIRTGCDLISMAVSMMRDTDLWLHLGARWQIATISCVPLLFIRPSRLFEEFRGP